MDYDKDIPDFALQPARSLDHEDGFDPSPYDRLLNFNNKGADSEDFEEKSENYQLCDAQSNRGNYELGDSENNNCNYGLTAEASDFACNNFGRGNLGDEAEPPIYELTESPTYEPQTAELTESPTYEPQTAELTEAPTYEPQTAELTEAPTYEPQTAELTEVPTYEPQTAELTEAPTYEPQTAELTESPTYEPQTAELTEAPTYEPPTAEPAAYQDIEPQFADMPVADTVDYDRKTKDSGKTGESANTTQEATAAASDTTLIVPAPGTLITSELKMTDIREKPEIKIYVEEDILVPDTKEDLASILSMTGKVNLAETELRAAANNGDAMKIAGEIDLHTLYIPENYEGEHHIINIQSRLPFKTERSIAVAPNSRIVIKPTVESIDYTVVNERKFRAKLTVRLSMREYANVEMQVFQGIRGEKLELLKEKIQMTHVSERKTDTMEISETLSLKDTQPKPSRILKYNVDIVENHKQITEDKAVVNATIYCNVLYLGTSIETEPTEESGESMVKTTPQLFQGKTEFTQFIPLSNTAEGSKISFSYNNLTVHIKESDGENSLENAFMLEGDVETSIETYKNLEREIVTDIYHKSKDIVCDKVELEAMSLGGSGVTEAAVREIVNIPEKYGDVKRVIYIFGSIKNSNSFLEQNKNIVEGVVEITLLCLPEDEKKTAFALNKDIGFRGAMEIPMGRGDTKANSDIAIKELWFDRINAKQIEVNANLFISSSVYGQDKYRVIQNVCFAAPKEEQGAKPGMVVYITKHGDTLWDIAKKYRTTMEMITEINDLPEGQSLRPDMKLLIVK